MSQLNKRAGVVGQILAEMAKRSATGKFEPVVILIPGQQVLPPAPKKRRDRVLDLASLGAIQGPRSGQPVRGYVRAKTPRFRPSLIGR